MKNYYDITAPDININRGRFRLYTTMFFIFVIMPLVYLIGLPCKRIKIITKRITNFFAIFFFLKYNFVKSCRQWLQVDGSGGADSLPSNGNFLPTFLVGRSRLFGQEQALRASQRVSQQQRGLQSLPRLLGKTENFSIN